MSTVRKIFSSVSSKQGETGFNVHLCCTCFHIMSHLVQSGILVRHKAVHWSSSDDPSLLRSQDASLKVSEMTKIKDNEEKDKGSAGKGRACFELACVCDGLRTLWLPIQCIIQTTIQTSSVISICVLAPCQQVSAFAVPASCSSPPSGQSCCYMCEIMWYSFNSHTTQQLGTCCKNKSQSHTSHKLWPWEVKQ